MTPPNQGLQRICAPCLAFRKHAKPGAVSLCKGGGDSIHSATEQTEQMSKIIHEQPDDSSYDEVLRELAFARMVERGIEDSDAKRTISNAEMKHRIKHGKFPRFHNLITWCQAPITPPFSSGGGGGVMITPFFASSDKAIEGFKR